MDHAPPPASASPSRRVRRFKRFIILLTLALVAGTIASFRVGRFYAVQGANAARTAVVRWVTGLGPDRSEIEADWARKRRRAVEGTTEVLTKFYDGTDEKMRALFRTAGMDPEHGLVRYGRADQTFLLSSQVFEPDDQGRSYRLRPNTRSVWLRQVTLHNGPFGLFQVIDAPAQRQAAGEAGAIVDEPSITTTNSWGLRGPEPDPTAPLRGVVLGDSFMQGMFNGDDQTPPVYLTAQLWKLEGVRVSVANTGHIGYSPEQYYYALREYGERMKPHFVVVSVCPNDFGEGFDILKGRADWLDEAAYWIDLIFGWCRSHDAICVLVPVPTYPQVESSRKDGFYPGLVNNIFPGPPANYCDPLERFLDENLQFRKQAKETGASMARSPLYNRHIDDDHFSPKGADVWAEYVARRVSLLMATSGRSASPSPPGPKVTSRPSSTEPRR
ncbi:SGNH/GDSL hydrolase family protein [Paludisphaera mucosa]|uniref:SGNH/GDSL hydrolase family protein n=1 Tax=Paludisphaera mucosa TaxID=3030827 RepID=A0ABT6F7A8_9BACT|nr:SGNH/GDSL hydrolase family protein [Paludisphaera mucosa]MDG3003480.1 SGNH/GDSL hydrolase family protein [Paludisphaera mucosa]